MPYERCADVSGELWNDLQELDPEEVTGRTGAVYKENLYHLPFLNRKMLISLPDRQVRVAGKPEAEPGFRACLTALQYLLHVDVSTLGPPISALELPGGATFFRGHHGLPAKPLETRFGEDKAGFRAAGERLGGEARAAGDAALALPVFPGLLVEVILWEADAEFPAQVSFTVPANLDKFWHLDAVWGLLSLVGQELITAADAGA
ncbi:MAG: DUF3786 domain-containing protein [Deltaproteobacteria bacterium]|nr:DUF3786 domain-containing protein [Deltaproteobacteria bacterium]